jgi:H+/Cl- antiporter ClcA
MTLLKKIAFWIFIIVIIGTLAGTASAFFLWTLDHATQFRLTHSYIIYALPIVGLLVGLLYHYYGEKEVKGNNLLLEEFHEPSDVIHIRMAPLVYIGTMLSHLVGASVGREGTAVQMSGAIADQATHYFKLSANARKALIIIGISAGFASVFGTPWAGAIFALEVFHSRKLQVRYFLQSILAAFVAHFVCLSWGIQHSTYVIPYVPVISFINIFWAINAGVIFGLISYLFAKSSHTFTDIFQRYIKFPPFRPFIGGLFIVVVYYFFDMNKYMGLGLPSISAAFTEPMNSYDFLIKLFLTAFTLGVGFKGGEVTPLFFIGATLGNVLIWFIPLPMALLAGMGFVAVFAGATNTLFACVIMGIELFGMGSSVYVIIACLVAYLFSGHISVYSSQQHH